MDTPPDKGGGGNSFSRYITIKSYEEFIAQIQMNDDVRNRYFYEMLKWAEHSRAQKNKRLAKYRKKKAEALAAPKPEPVVPAPVPAPTPVPAITVQPGPKVIQLYQGDPRRRGSTLSIPDNTLFPRSR